MAAPPLTAGPRPPLVDGLFYPAGREECAARVDGLLASAPGPRGNGFAVISPHAGWDYAGEVMAAAFSFVAARPVRTAIVVGPAHRDPVDAVYLPESTSFETPLGDLPVDTARVAALCAAEPLFRVDDIPHLEEHCLEVQLPFLARLFPGVAIVPMLVGSNRAAVSAALARALRLTLAESGDYTVLVVTANMASSLGGRDPDAERAAMEELLARGDGKGMLAAAEARRLSACGVAGIAAAFQAGGAGSAARILARGSSRGRDAQDDRVVHYAAAGLLPSPGTEQWTR